MEETPKLALRGVKKRFGPKVVLDGVDLAVQPKQSVVVIGGSGTGKSVLLKCVLGLLRPEAGSIQVDGEETVGMKGADRQRVLRKFGMLFQGAALFDSLPVWRNVAFGLIEGERMAAEQAKEIALEKLRRVGLGADVAELSPAELSGGMKKRVGLARAMALDPPILLVDEPSAGLDPITADEIDDLLCGLRDTRDTTLIVVTHNIPSARKVARRLMVLDEGRIVAEGTAEELDRSELPLVREFMRSKGGG